MDTMTGAWRRAGWVVWLLASATWPAAAGGNSGPGGNTGSGSGSGMSRPINLPVPSIGNGSPNGPGNGPGNRPPPSPNSGSGKDGKDGSRADDTGRDGPAGRDGAPRREADERGNSGTARPGSEAADNRWQRGERLVRSQPLVYERDPIGAPVLRAEITLLLPPDADLPDSLARRGFIAVRETLVLGRRLVVLRTPADLTLPMAVDLGRRLVPQAEIDFNHVLLASGRVEPVRLAAPAPAVTASAPEPVHVGLIDETVLPAPALASLADVRPIGRRCNAPPPQGHGTAVATVLARSVQQAGRRPVLHAADLGCGQGAVDAMAAALQAMDAERVPVVNVSAVGPYKDRKSVV